MPPDQHRSTLCDDLACRGDWGDVQWSRRRLDGGVRLDLARSPARAAARRRCGDRRGPRRARGEGRDVLRVGQRRGQLALPAGVERGDLVLRARQLGPSLPVRSADRPREAPDHERRGQRHAAAARGREEPACSTSWPSAGAGARSVLPPPLPHRHRRQEPAAADAGGRRPRRDAVAVGPVLRRHLLEARRAAGRRAARRGRQAGARAREGRHLAGWSPPAGSRRCRSR